MKLVPVSEYATQLADRLGERTRVIQDGGVDPSRPYVLYWLTSAMRAYENPALDISVWLGNQLGLPVVVYQGLSERHPYASDRHHSFILQGVADLQHQFRSRGITYGFHLERKGHRQPFLKSLATAAAVVVTDDMPVRPLTTWLQRLESATTTPILAVDTACVVPMQSLGRACDRAFEYRKRTARQYAERTSREWPPVPPELAAYPPRSLPFRSLDVCPEDIGELLAECDIDHGIGPVRHTTGGSTAGYARWDAFRERGLASYAKRRNDPLVDGVSRLSPYLHYGMVSPFRIAREAQQSPSAGAEKFLDELLIWRELAYSFCFYRQDHDRLTAIPAWARQTLCEHESDPRSALHSWETLARGASGDRLWDAAQKSLLVHGQLHNQVRMTWGKAILNWTPDPESALARIVDLNHRFALDGRDPASYGGILWCLGQFDRAFSPETPILGRVRPRPTTEHAQRLDPERFARRANRAMLDAFPRIAVIGGGISGLTCARTLHDHGFPVTVFEKSRGVGGRMATRRGAGGVHFDHGAQYFTVRDARFRRYVDSWMADGVVAAWEGTLCRLSDGNCEPTDPATDRFIGLPGMNAICRHLAADLDLRFETQVAPLNRRGRSWQLTATDGAELGDYDWVILSAPAVQAAGLLEAVPDLAEEAGSAVMEGCWAAMLSFDSPLERAWDAAFVQDSPLSWIACNSSKPGRVESPQTWVLHGSPEWSSSRLDDDASEILPEMLDAFWQATGIRPSEPTVATAHRWRYAIPLGPLDEPCLCRPDLQVGACGDWCSEARVEGAFLSGQAMAGRVLCKHFLP